MSWHFTRGSAQSRPAVERSSAERSFAEQFTGEHPRGRSPALGVEESFASGSSDWARFASSDSYDTSLTTSSVTIPGDSGDSGSSAEHDEHELPAPRQQPPSPQPLAQLQENQPLHQGGLGLGHLGRFRRQESPTDSLATSSQHYAEPNQTLVFFDWDDTLFPYTELFERWRVPLRREASVGLPEELERGLLAWREALHQYLTVACALSESVSIVTNSRRPWVDACIDRFAPNLRPLFSCGSGAPRVVYADEALGARSSSSSLSSAKASGNDRRTAAKLAAMQREAASFYSRYPEQTWKNILSLGDMKYEHDALHALGQTRTSISRERLRTKAILLPRAPTLSEMTLRLQFSRLMLPEYVRFNGDIDLDLTSDADPLQAIASALGIPRLGELPFPRHAWGRTPLPEGQEAASALEDVALTLHETLEDGHGMQERSTVLQSAPQPSLRPCVSLGAWKALAEGAFATLFGHLVLSSGAFGEAGAEDWMDFAHSTYTTSVAFVACLTLRESPSLQHSSPSLRPWSAPMPPSSVPLDAPLLASASSSTKGAGLGLGVPFPEAIVAGSSSAVGGSDAVVLRPRSSSYGSNPSVGRGSSQGGWTLAPWAERLATTMYLRSCGHLWADAVYVTLKVLAGRRPHCWLRRLLRCTSTSATNLSCLLLGPGASQRAALPCVGYLAELSSQPLRLTRGIGSWSAWTVVGLLVAKLLNFLWCLRVVHGAHRHLSSRCMVVQLCCACSTHALSTHRLFQLSTGRPLTVR